MPELPLFARARVHAAAPAFPGHAYTDFLNESAGLASVLLDTAADLGEARVALLVPAGPDYVIGQWAIWRAGGIKVPICLSATEPEWEYALTDSGAG
jgi:malonyl-CoA/methylmalonyl-CoA synthetase